MASVLSPEEICEQIVWHTNTTIHLTYNYQTLTYSEMARKGFSLLYFTNGIIDEITKKFYEKLAQNNTSGENT